MEFDLEYKLQQFKEVERDYFNENGERYTGTPIGKENSEMMLQLINELSGALAKVETEIRQLTIPVVMSRISHFVDENGTAVDLNAEGVNVRLKRDGTNEYFRSFGFAGRKELTPVYGA